MIHIDKINDAASEFNQDSFLQDNECAFHAGVEFAIRELETLISEIIEDCANSAKAYRINEFGEKIEDSNSIDKNSILKLKNKYLKNE